MEAPSGERSRGKGRHGVLCRLKSVWSMPERFRVVCTIQGAIQMLWFTFFYLYVSQNAMQAGSAATAGSERKTANILYVVCRATRFRWTQTVPLHDKRNSSRTAAVTSWAIDDVYIGRSCLDFCHGHGRCDFPNCVCDDGYSGVTCDVPSTQHQVNYMTLCEQTCFF